MGICGHVSAHDVFKTRVYVCLCVYLCVCVCLCVCLSVCLSVHAYVYLCMYVYHPKIHARLVCGETMKQRRAFARGVVGVVRVDPGLVEVIHQHRQSVPEGVRACVRVCVCVCVCAGWVPWFTM